MRGCLSARDLDRLVHPLLGEHWLPGSLIYDVRTGATNVDAARRRIHRTLDRCGWVLLAPHVAEHWMAAVVVAGPSGPTTTVYDSAPTARNSAAIAHVWVSQLLLAAPKFTTWARQRPGSSDCGLHVVRTAFALLASRSTRVPALPPAASGTPPTVCLAAWRAPLTRALAGSPTLTEVTATQLLNGCPHGHELPSVPAASGTPKPADATTIQLPAGDAREPAAAPTRRAYSHDPYVPLVGFEDAVRSAGRIGLPPSYAETAGSQLTPAFAGARWRSTAVTLPRAGWPSGGATPAPRPPPPTAPPADTPAAPRAPGAGHVEVTATLAGTTAPAAVPRPVTGHPAVPGVASAIRAPPALKPTPTVNPREIPTSVTKRVAFAPSVGNALAQGADLTPRAIDVDVDAGPDVAEHAPEHTSAAAIQEALAPCWGTAMLPADMAGSILTGHILPEVARVLLRSVLRPPDRHTPKSGLAFVPIGHNDHWSALAVSGGEQGRVAVTHYDSLYDAGLPPYHHAIAEHLCDMLTLPAPAHRPVGRQVSRQCGLHVVRVGLSLLPLRTRRPSVLLASSNGVVDLSALAPLVRACVVSPWSAAQRVEADKAARLVAPSLDRPRFLSSGFFGGHTTRPLVIGPLPYPLPIRPIQSSSARGRWRGVRNPPGANACCINAPAALLWAGVPRSPHASAFVAHARSLGLNAHVGDGSGRRRQDSAVDVLRVVTAHMSPQLRQSFVALSRQTATLCGCTCTDREAVTVSPGEHHAVVYVERRGGTLGAAMRLVEQGETVTGDAACVRCKTATRTVAHNIFPGDDAIIFEIQAGVDSLRPSEKNTTQFSLEDEISLGGARWRLRAAVLHHGSVADSGHFTTAVHDGEHWLEHDDADVRTLTSRPSAIDASAVLALYSRQPIPTVPVAETSGVLLRVGEASTVRAPQAHYPAPASATTQQDPAEPNSPTFMGRRDIANVLRRLSRGARLRVEWQRGGRVATWVGIMDGAHVHSGSRTISYRSALCYACGAFHELPASWKKTEIPFPGVLYRAITLETGEESVIVPHCHHRRDTDRRREDSGEDSDGSDSEDDEPTPQPTTARVTGTKISRCGASIPSQLTEPGQQPMAKSEHAVTPAPARGTLACDPVPVIAKTASRTELRKALIFDQEPPIPSEPALGAAERARCFVPPASVVGSRGDIGRDWHVFSGRPPHQQVLVWNAVAASTRRTHITRIERIRALSAHPVRAGMPLESAIIELVLELAEARHWAWSTIAGGLGAAQAALLALPLYSTAPRPIVLSTNPAWTAALKRARHLARVEVRNMVGAAPMEVRDYERIMTTIKGHRTWLLGAMVWHFASRVGDLRQCRPDDIVVGSASPASSADRDVTHLVTITFRYGKGAAFCGPFSVCCRLPATVASALVELLISARARPDAPLWASRDQSALSAAVAGSCPGCSLRSLRKGALVRAAAHGVPDGALMVLSGHRRMDTLHRYLGWGAASSTKAETAALIERRVPAPALSIPGGAVGGGVLPGGRPAPPTMGPYAGFWSGSKGRRCPKPPPMFPLRPPSSEDLGLVDSSSSPYVDTASHAFNAKVPEPADFDVLLNFATGAAVEQDMRRAGEWLRTARHFGPTADPGAAPIAAHRVPVGRFTDAQLDAMAAAHKFRALAPGEAVRGTVRGFVVHAHHKRKSRPVFEPALNGSCSADARPPISYPSRRQRRAAMTIRRNLRFRRLL